MNQVKQSVVQHDIHEEQVEKGYEQIHLHLQRTPTRATDQDQSNNSKSKNKLSKKIRDDLKKRLEAQNREAQVNPTLMLEEINISSPSQGMDNQNNTIESQKSKISSQQSKQDTPIEKGTQPFLVANQGSLRNPLFEYSQEGLSSTSSMRKDEQKRGQQKKGRNKKDIDTKFALVTEQASLVVPPLQIHDSPPRECTLNSISAVPDDINDEYRVIHSEDEFDQDSQSI
ncbi:hypothetical protein HAX54_031853, partial [Datura stramonium]|nr:hypothetical protein [Datura stramonium]